MQYTSKEVYEYVSKKTNDPIVERKKCRVSGQDFPIYKSDLDFYEKISPEFWGGKFSIPAPDICYQERERRRHSRKNLRKLYSRKCKSSGKHILSIYSPDKPYNVYENNIWRNISWDDSNSKKSFKNDESLWAQFMDLLKQVPLMNLNSVNVENSDYNNILLNSKNCYLCFSTWDSEDCLYQTLSAWDKNCVDGYWLLNSEICYENVDCDKCFNCFYTNNCQNSKYLYYCDNCSGCEYCYFCSNLNNQKYCILNKQYSKDDYERMTETFSQNKIIQNYLVKYEELLSQNLSNNKNKNSTNCFGWNNINSNNCVFCFETTQCTDCKYCANIWLDAVRCYDCGGGDIFKSEFCYECVWVSNSYNVLFSYNCINCSNMFYCLECYNCKNCFACIWLKDKEYCILNKQYNSKEEYECNVKEIIKNMQNLWERWYPIKPDYSPFGYNETIAMDFYPLTREKALKMWYKRSDYESPMPNVEKTVLWGDLPKVSCKVIQEKKPDFLKKILNYAVLCEISKRPFRLTKQEIDFYVKYNIPLPTKHPDIRYIDRVKRKWTRELFLVKCSKCWNVFPSIYKTNINNLCCDECFSKHE